MFGQSSSAVTASITRSSHGNARQSPLTSESQCIW